MLSLSSLLGLRDVWVLLIAKINTKRKIRTNLAGHHRDSICLVAHFYSRTEYSSGVRLLLRHYLLIHVFLNLSFLSSLSRKLDLLASISKNKQISKRSQNLVRVQVLLLCSVRYLCPVALCVTANYCPTLSFSFSLPLVFPSSEKVSSQTAS